MKIVLAVFQMSNGQQSWQYSHMADPMSGWCETPSGLDTTDDLMQNEAMQLFYSIAASQCTDVVTECQDQANQQMNFMSKVIPHI